MSLYTDDFEDTSASNATDKPQRKRIVIDYIGDKSRRHITFSKRKAGTQRLTQAS